MEINIFNDSAMNGGVSFVHDRVSLPPRPLFRFGSFPNPDQHPAIREVSIAAVVATILRCTYSRAIISALKSVRRH